MNDDRTLERAARSWLEAGPSEAPDHALEAALLRIQTTHQERDLRVPWRDRPMSTTARVAVAAIAIAVVAVGGTLILRPGGNPNVGGPTSTSTVPASQTPSPADDLAALQAYRAARDQVCGPSMAQLLAIADAPSGATPSEQANHLEEVISLVTAQTDHLAAIGAPPAVAVEHAADVTRHRDGLVLLAEEVDLLRAGKQAEANAVDQATAGLSSLSEAFERKYSLAPCP